MDINCTHQLDYWEEECSRCDGLKKCKVRMQPKKTEFFMPMIPPTKTHQEKKVKIIYQDGEPKPQFYEPDELKAVRSKFTAYLAKHVPKEKYTGAIRVIVKWLFPIGHGKHVNGEYKVTKPDTHNLNKMLFDVMTDLGYWTDDALVASEIIEKFYSDIPGIYIAIESLEGDKHA